jgi:hypothetical protein
MIIELKKENISYIHIEKLGLVASDAKRLGLNTLSIDSGMGIVVGAQLHTDGYVDHARLVIDEDLHQSTL